MIRTAVSMAAAALLAAALPARADEIADLKAEIAAQKAAAAAQQARLDALERKLDAMQTAPAAAPAVAAASNAPSGVNYTYGSGLTIGSAQAGSLTLYGLIDVSYVHTNHADSASHDIASPRVAWFSGNRWGITGTRPLGNSGMNVLFRLESEFESQTGNMDTPGVLFNRDAWVGIESKTFGKLTMGRQNSLTRDPIASAIYGDPYGSAAPSLEEGGYTNNNNFKQLIFYAGSATGTRLDNGVVWKKAFDNGLYAAAQYQFGTIPGDSSNGTTKSAALAYAGGMFNLSGYVTDARVAHLNNTSYSFGGNVIVGDWRFNGGWFHYSADQGAKAALGKRKDNAYTLSAKWAPAGAWDYELGYQVMKADHAAVNGGGNVINAFANASGATATATGSRSTLYGSVFYHFDKITEVYFGGDYLKLKDGYKVGATNGAPNQTEVVAGIRTRF